MNNEEIIGHSLNALLDDTENIKKSVRGNRKKLEHTVSEIFKNQNKVYTITDEDIKNITENATPIKGEDYFTETEIEEFKKDVTPIKDVDYFDGDDGYTPVKGKDYFDGKDGKNGKDGKQGKNGINGGDGKDGAKGDKGDIGSIPKHEWNDLKLRFELPEGWGKWVDLGKNLKTVITSGATRPGQGSFLDLTDVPTTYEGNALKTLRVNSAGDGLEFSTGSGIVDWGEIGGTLADQTDLQTALNAKFTLPALTSGSVLFSNGTTIAQDNANFFWDDTLNQLLLPKIVGGTAIGSNLIYQSTTGAGTAAGIAHQWTGGTNGGTVIATMLNDGNVGIGNTSPTSTLDITSNKAVTSISAEQITNSVDRDFTGSSGNWTLTAGWAYGTNNLSYTYNASPRTATLANTYLTAAPVAGTPYLITFTVYKSTSAGTGIKVGFGGSTPSSTYGIYGKTVTLSVIRTAVNTSPLTLTAVGSGIAFTIDNVSVKIFTPSIAPFAMRDIGGTTSLEIRPNAALESFSLGYDSGTNNIGMGNSSFGWLALKNNITGTYNTAIGGYALYNNTTGNYNVAIGYSSFYEGTSCNKSVIIGYSAGSEYGLLNNANTDLVLIGCGAYCALTVNNGIAIGSGAVVAISDSVVLGNSSITSTFLRGNVGIGASTVAIPSARLLLPAGTATASTAPLKFTSGTLLTAPEAGAVEFLTDDFYATITTGTARKKFALLPTDASFALTAAKTFTVQNTLTLSGTDGSTLAIGTGGTLGTGAYATIADYAPVAQTFYIGTTQVAINRASAALTLAGITLTTPEIGSATGTSLDLGTTTLYGSRAITVDTGGVFDVSIGSAAGDDFTVDTNKLVVEGDTGNVGIGTTTPYFKLDVAGNIRIQGINLLYFGGSTSSNDWNTRIGLSGSDFAFSSARFIWTNSGYAGTVSTWMNLASSGTTAYIGNLGLGTTTPTYKLDVKANGYIVYNPAFTGTGLNDVYGYGTYTGTDTAAPTYTVIIDATGTPDTFKWQKNAGAFTTGVAITGSAQNLSDGVQVRFMATTGHTLNDQWVISTQFSDPLRLSSMAGAALMTVSNTGVVNISNLTASELVATDANKNLVSLAVATYPSLTELSYVKGVTSAIQTQINGKAASTHASTHAVGGADAVFPADPGADKFLKFNNTSNAIEWADATGGSGITRTVESKATDFTAGSTASVDYVYFLTGTTTCTLPTAVGNTNRYTIKSISGTTTVACNGAETIDGAATIGIQNEDSVDLVSNNTEWKVV